MKLHVSLSMPMVAESTYKPVWAKTLAANESYLKTLRSNVTLSQVATVSKGERRLAIEKVTLNEYEEFIFVSDEFNGVQSIQYGVRVKTFAIKGLKDFKTVGQVSVWRNKNYIYLHSGFAAWVFKTILFPTYGNVVSDNSQSSSGKAFWMTRITDELELGTYCYALGIEQPKPHQYVLEEIHTITKTSEALKYYSVAPDTRGEFYRILLSKHPLTIKRA